MNSRKTLFCVMSAALVLAVTANGAPGAAISIPNLFSGTKSYSSSSEYNGSFAAGNAFDGGVSSQFIFSDGDGNRYLSISGFDSAVNSLRFFNNYGIGAGGQRASGSVDIYYSTTSQTSINPNDYTYLKNVLLPTLVGDPNTQYALTGTDGNPYAEASNLKIANAKSLLLKFGPEATANYGPALTEVQGFAAPRIDDAGVLRGKPVTVSNTYGDVAFNAAYATDGTGAQQVFADPANDQRMVVNELTSGFDTIRLWRDPETPRVPARVLIKSSKNNTNSLDASNFENTLADLSSLAFNAAGYADIAVSAAVNTQSLYFDFGVGDSLGQSNGVRIVEVQAFGVGVAVPEPSAMALMASTVAGLLAYAWRKRR